MKFQHLILPSALWLLVGVSIFVFVPTSPFIIGLVLVLIALAAYFSVRIVRHGALPYVISGAVFLFLLSSVLTGFSLINLLLIVAIATLISQLVPNP